MFPEPPDLAAPASGSPRDWYAEVQANWRLGLHQIGARQAMRLACAKALERLASVGDALSAQGG